MSLKVFLAGQVRNLRENLLHSLHPDVVAATGMIPPDIDAEKAYHEYLEKKYL